MTPSALFRADELACRRGDRLIFQGLHFALPPGSALLLHGPNGSGKTSLLRLLAGLLPNCDGALWWGDEKQGGDPDSASARLHYVGHQDAIKSVLSVTENLTFWARLQDPSVTSDQIGAALASLALAPLASLPAKFLSAGQRRRLALARLLATPKPLWLLDEPSVGLDRDSVVRLERLIASHRALGGIVLLSTHIDLALPDAQTLHLDQFAPPADHMHGVWQ